MRIQKALRITFYERRQNPANSQRACIMRPTLKQRLSGIVKLAVTALGLYLALRQAPLDEIALVVWRADIAWLALALGLILFSLVVRAGRWQILLRGVGIQLPLGRLTRLYFIGHFFNAFLPTGFGGDVARALSLAGVRRSEAAGSVLVDRLMGLLALFALALAVMPFRPSGFPDELARTITAVALAGLAAGWLLLDGRLIRRVWRWLPGWLTDKLPLAGDGPLARLLYVMQNAGWRALMGALAISFLFNLMMVGWWAAVSRALYFDVSYAYYLLVAPILSVALLTPSIGGLGVREMLAPLLLMGAGLTPAQAVALSLVEFALVRLSGLIGAPIYLFTPQTS
jgi:glycosyltransferase 2 family protein